MGKNKIIPPIILGLLIALVAAGAYSLAHTSSEQTQETQTPIMPGARNSMGMGGMMGMMGHSQSMMQGGLMAQQFQGMQGPGFRGPMAGPQGFMESLGATEITGTVASVDVEHHSIIIETSDGTVEVMVPGYWITSEGSAVTWYELLGNIKVGDTVTASVIYMPCGESIAVSLSVGGLVYENAMISQH